MSEVMYETASDAPWNRNQTEELERMIPDWDRPGDPDERSDEALVGEGSECPNCGEDRMDYLTWDEDGEIVTCYTCGTEYVPGTEDGPRGHNDRMVAPDGTIA